MHGKESTQFREAKKVEAEWKKHKEFESFNIPEREKRHRYHSSSTMSRVGLTAWSQAETSEERFRGSSGGVPTPGTGFFGSTPKDRQSCRYRFDNRRWRRQGVIPMSG